MCVKFAKWVLLSYTVKFKLHSSWASEAFEKGGGDQSREVWHNKYLWFKND